MITEQCGAHWLSAAFLALASWWSLLLAWPVLDDRVRNVTVIALSEAHLIRAIGGADVALLEGRGRIMVLAGRSAGFVRRLYASGGVIVLATDGRGCTGAARGIGRP